MSYNAFAAPLRLELGHGRLLRLWRLLVHGVVALSLPLLQSPLIMLLIAAVLLVSLLRKTPAPPSVLLWHSEGHWDLLIEGRSLRAELAYPACVLTWMVILPLRCQDRRRPRYLVILPDMLPAQTFRRLRVRLRMAGFTPAEPASDEPVI